ncbi:hypothetical protein EMIHUDRAFT_204715 [Emiliania huxleyi CCMP1516]|uniref:Uncharacterized protein n=2 Tax=Emiliania huxleyi TaxID=2903 RepID=A0A0D3JW76_EMIH1|nr:hypothetical protein EMIHUDRAFT_204715 [Emiliania huxleyi CCMP1516]EOD27761.1 hypothetical protein EMIHUDRAFT_204715 [Emiliania huxleyi CCMP1516]|eukprot:XP_005780190.1 hypothetical protein EMIHUDRAFT_204715 [Emiliania huxleyi CCMP1516]
MVPRSVEVAALLVPLPNVPSAADAVWSGSAVPGSALLSSALVSVSSSLASLLFFLPFLYALYIASIPFRVSTILKPAQQLNRSLASPLSWIHLCTAPVAASATICKFLVTRAPRQAPLSKCAIVALGGFSSSSVHCCAAFRTIGHSGGPVTPAVCDPAVSPSPSRPRTHSFVWPRVA